MNENEKYDKVWMEVYIMDKTLVMKILDQKKIKYNAYQYESEELDAVTCANLIGKDPLKVFKTLVVRGSKSLYVFMIPSVKELSLKKCAKLVNEKKVEMLPYKELEMYTGYIHGGCSPIGMKKEFPTFIDEVALLFDTIYFSAGKVGLQIECSYDDLKKVIDVNVSDITN